MARKKTGWRAAFLRALGQSGNVRVAAGEAGVDPGTAYDWRAKDDDFARRWEAGKAKGVATAKGRAGKGELVLRRTRHGDRLVRAAAGRWSATVEEAFLDALRETACVRSAAAAAGISTTALYNRRDNYAEFAERWQAVESEARARLPDLLVAASLASLQPAAKTRKRGAGRPLKVNIDQAIRISAIEARKSAAGPGLRGRGRRPRIATNAEVREALTEALVAFGTRIGDTREERLASGWTELGDGTMIPPGWVYVGTGGEA